ncbi:MAG: hypothetical protein HYW02_04245 [Deltaproteobacteria bacterium]|nr:hypothetical protein [Deltaproteobacteria bacterium]
MKFSSNLPGTQNDNTYSFMIHPTSLRDNGIGYEPATLGNYNPTPPPVSDRFELFQKIGGPSQRRSDPEETFQIARSRENRFLEVIGTTLLLGMAGYGGWGSDGTGQFGLHRSPIHKGWLIGGGIALMAGITILAIYLHAQHENEVWSKSKSANNMTEVEAAAKKGDAEELDEIGKKARERHGRIKKHIENAVARAAKRVENRTKDPIDLAKKYEVFDRMTYTRADLNENRYSTDPTSRVGGELLSTWQQRSQETEAKAAKDGFEGFMAMLLDEMGTASSQQLFAYKKLEKNIEDYEKIAPSFFGGLMKYQAETARTELKEFKTAEIDQEIQVRATYNGRMRQRISGKFYASREDYKTHFDHHTRLKNTFDSLVKPTADIARNIDRNLDEAIQHRNQENIYLVMAEAHRNDIVRVCDTDSDGNSSCHTETKDNSFMYRALASTEASAAQRCAQAAKTGLESLRPLVAQLYANAIISEEGLQALVPKGVTSKIVSDGHDPVWDWFLPPLFGIFNNMGTINEASRARGQFGSIHGSLLAIESQIASRRDGEDQWINHEIDVDVEAQKKEAWRKNAEKASVGHERGHFEEIWDWATS